MKSPNCGKWPAIQANGKDEEAMSKRRKKRGKNKKQAGRNWLVMTMEAICAACIICSQMLSSALLSHWWVHSSIMTALIFISVGCSRVCVNMYWCNNNQSKDATFLHLHSDLVPSLHFYIIGWIKQTQVNQLGCTSLTFQCLINNHRCWSRKSMKDNKLTW